MVDAGGLVGTHAGDGIVAFFLAETSGSESAAARPCITAARTMQDAVGDVAARCDLPPEDVVLRFGMHWGANLYVGQIATSGRTEVTALGDQVLVPDDATALAGRHHLHAAGRPGDRHREARRDAPAIAVCEV